MQPVLFTIGPLPVSSFGLALLIAFWVGIAMTRRRSPAIGIDRNAMLDLALYMIIAGIVGARIGYVLANLGAFIRNPLTALFIWRDAGLTFYGAIAGGALVARFYARRTGVSFARLLDAATPGLIVGYAVAMVGALLHGLYPGKATTVPWAVTLRTTFEQGHPVPLYLLIAAVGIYAVLRAQRDPAPGFPFLTFLFLQALSRFVVDFFVQSATVLGPLTAAHAASAVVGALALVGLLRVARRPRLPAPQPAVAGPDAQGGGVAQPDAGAREPAPPLPPS